METNEVLREQIIEVIDNQIRDNKPKETKFTYNRLIGLGYSKTDSKQLIAQCMVLELFDVLKHKKQFNDIRYIDNLGKLPTDPFD